MKRQSFEDLIPLFISGDLSPEERLRFEAELENNSRLREETKRAGEILKLAGSISAPPERPSFASSLAGNVREELNRKRFFFLRPVPALAAVLTIAIAFLLIYPVFTTSRIEKLETWLVENMDKADENITSEQVAWQYLNDDEISGLQSELLSSLKNSDLEYTDNPSSLFGWDIYLSDEEVSADFIENNFDLNEELQ